MIDVVSNALGMTLIFLFIPLGPRLYLAAVTAQAAVVLSITLVVLYSTGGIRPSQIRSAILPPIAAASAAIAAVIGVRTALPPRSGLAPGVVFEGVVFVLVFLAATRLWFATLLRELLGVAPGGRQINRLMLLR
jgi:hypothetical protein